MKRNDAQVESLLDRLERLMQRFRLIFNGNEFHWNQQGHWELDDDPGEDGQAVVSRGPGRPPTWGVGSGVYDICYYLPGTPDASARLGRIVQVRSVLMPASLTASRASCRVAATSERVLSINHNVTLIGTITFAAAATTGVFAFASNVTLAAGDILEIQMPATEDDTFSDPSVTFACERLA